MPDPSAKRFYETVDTVTVDGGYGIALDGRPVPTPLGQPLILPTMALAEAVAGEWRAQGDSVNPRSMPLSGLANTAIDRTVPRRTVVIDELLRFGDS
ncbi:MAG: ATP12 family protein, partial [Alphaproteobacteria bacterium]